MNETRFRVWPSTLQAVLGLLYLWIGSVTQGWDRLFGLAGGLAVLVATVVARRSATAMTLLAIGVLPLAVATWWSVLTPALAILALLNHVLAIRHTGHAPGDLRSSR